MRHPSPVHRGSTRFVEVNMLLNPTERIDDLVTRDLKIIQSGEVFSFSLDAVLLARFCTVPHAGRVADLCSGNGVIPILLSTRTKAHITGVEIQERLWDMAVRSAALNGLADRIEFVCRDLREWARETAQHGAFDLVTVNPPYMPVPSGDLSANEHVAIARHEVKGTLEEIIAASARLVRSGGRMAMVHRPSRLIDIVTLLRKYRLEPKRVRFVHPRPSAEANMVLIESLRDGKPDLRLMPPLIVYNEKQQYTTELLEVFHGRATELHG
jgi:tRNA1(Val) A37 N6-methylase TrmN6